nr:MAG TPA: hypothetical protein [Caudoviricetes sp.]
MISILSIKLTTKINVYKTTVYLYVTPEILNQGSWVEAN